MTNNRWFEVYITDGLDKYYEKSTIPLIYILTLKAMGGAPLVLGYVLINPTSHKKRSLEFGFTSL